MKNPSIWIFNHYAQSDNLPGGTRHYDLAQELVKNGFEVTIFASGFHHALLRDVVKYNKKKYFIEDISGVKFIWVKTHSYQKNGLNRMINIVSYALRLNYIIPNLNLLKPDIIIGSTVHPFAGIIAKKFSKKYEAKFIFEIRDLWPQTFIDMGLWKKNGFSSRVFRYIEKITVRGSKKMIVLSPLTIKYLKETYGYNQKNILLLPNGVKKNFLNKTPKYEGNNKIDITYLGGIDKVHGLEYLISLANEIKDNNITFNIYGEGKEKKNLQTLCEAKNLKNIIWHGSVPKTDVPKVLSESTVLFVSTSNVLYGSENKLYDYMASAKPIILAIRGNHNNPIQKIGCGLTLDRDDVKESALKLTCYLKDEFEYFEEIGKKGQEYVIKNRTTEILANNLITFIDV